jgi:hypothetical protein
MNLPSNKEPPLPNPLLHKYVEEREMERREGFMGSMREFLFRRILSPHGGERAGRGVRCKLNTVTAQRATHE